MFKQVTITLAILVLQSAATKCLLEDGCHDEDYDDSEELALLQSFRGVKMAVDTGITDASRHTWWFHGSYVVDSLSPNFSKASGKHITLLFIVGVVLLFTLATAVIWLHCFPRVPDQDPVDEEIEEVGNVAMEEDAYYLAVATLIRDVHKIACRTPGSRIGLHMARLFTSIFLVAALIFMQAALVYQVKLFVTGSEVSKIRDTYDKYEFHMYGSQEDHTYLNVNGKHRGLAEFFKPELFNSLDQDLKREVCAIPLSQLSFFSMILFIWTLTCVCQIKRCMELAVHVLMTPTASNMVEIMREEQDDSGEKVHVLVGLTMTMKFALAVGIFVPWFGITAYLLWVGSRWLTSTNDWASLVGDAVALEFILSLKELLYYAVVPERTKRLLRHTSFMPISKVEPAGVVGFVGGFLWGLLALGWVYIYIHNLQAVLPEYKYDVHGVCSTYFQHLLAKPDDPESA
mmetsp:Transcript_94303/g.172871  ORF Transcript_94303/g.172871 Transcript_94303/m.172871 type:complete len:458 (-) Transcript_94303:85-1458(-)